MIYLEQTCMRDDDCVLSQWRRSFQMKAGLPLANMGKFLRMPPWHGHNFRITGPFVSGIHCYQRDSTVTLCCFLCCYPTSYWTNSRITGDLRRHNTHVTECNVTVAMMQIPGCNWTEITGIIRDKYSLWKSGVYINLINQYNYINSI